MKIVKTICKCGAITLEGVKGDISIFSNSMSLETYEKLKDTLSKYNIETKFPIVSACNHCVNHWGIDLCGCGSGKRVGDCDNEYYECNNDITMQTVFRDYVNNL